MKPSVRILPPFIPFSLGLNPQYLVELYASLGTKVENMRGNKQQYNKSTFLSVRTDKTLRLIKSTIKRPLIKRLMWGLHHKKQQQRFAEMRKKCG